MASEERAAELEGEEVIEILDPVTGDNVDVHSVSY